MHFYTDVRIRNGKVYSTGYELGLKFTKTENYEPYVFLRDDNAIGDYKTTLGLPVRRVDFDKISMARDFVKRHADVTGFDIYGLTDFQYLYIYDTFKNLQFDINLVSVVYLDIETKYEGRFPNIVTADQEITAITLRKNAKSVTLGCKFFRSEDSNHYYVRCQDEHELLQKFIELWRSPGWAPDIVSHWNGEIFDIPYLINRIKRLFGAEEVKKLSPFGFVDDRVVEIGTRKHPSYTIGGIVSLDYLNLYKKFSFKNQESHRLDYIANVELGERKINYSEFKNLNELYEKDYNKFILYNERDAVLVQRLENKLKFIQQVITLAFITKTNFTDVLGTVLPWDIFVHSYLMDNKIVVNPKKHTPATGELVGAFVKPPPPAYYEWVVSLDFTSLYPSLIRMFNISQDVFVNKVDNIPPIDELIDKLTHFKAGLKHQDLTMTANGCLFKRTKPGFFAVLMKQVFDQRVVYKNKMLEYKREFERTKANELQNHIAYTDNMQKAFKVFLNSGYGAYANEWFRWFDQRFAEAVTTSGQLVLKYIIRRLNEHFNNYFKTDGKDYIIGADTDSVYIDLRQFETGCDRSERVKKTEDFITKEIQPKIAEWLNELYDCLNVYEPCLSMKLEKIASGVWTGKKHYILNKYYDESVVFKEPKIDVVGIESVKSSTPQICRTKLKEAFNIIMNKEEATLIKFVDEFRQEFYALPFEDVASPRGVNGLDKFKDAAAIYSKGTPMHVRGALLHNDLLEKKGLTNKYQMIYDGSKIKFCYLKMPNPIFENVISCVDGVPDEFGLEEYIDYETQFEKTFLKPVESVIEILGWRSKEISTLEEFLE